MTFTKVSSGTAVSGASPQSPAVNSGAGTTAHNLCVIYVAMPGYTAAPTFTFPAGWVRGPAQAYIGGASAQIWYLKDCAAGITTVSVSWTGGTTQTGAAVILLGGEFAGGDTTAPLDLAASGHGTTGLTYSETGTPTGAAHELAVTVTAAYNSTATAQTLAAGAGFTQLAALNNGASARVHGSGDYELDTGVSGSTVTDSVTITANASGFAWCLATFKAAAGGESGAFAVSLPLLLTSVSATITHLGSFAVSLPLIRSSLAGAAQQTESGAFAISPPMLRSSVSATIAHRGTFSISLPLLRSSLAGAAQQTESGAFAVSLPLLLTSLTSTLIHRGTFSISLPLIRSSLVGTAQQTESGSFSSTLPMFRANLASTVTHLGSFAMSLPLPRTTLSGGKTTLHAGAFLIVLPPGQRNQVEAGSLAIQMPALRVVLQAKVGISCSFNIVLPRPVTSMAGSAQQTIIGTLQLSLPVAVVGLAGHVPAIRSGPVALSLPVAQISMTGLLTHMGVLSISLGISQHLTRYEMFGCETHGPLELVMPFVTIELQGKIVSTRLPIANWQHAKATRRQHAQQLKAARRTRAEGEHGEHN